MTADAHQSVVPQWTLQDKIRKAREYAGLSQQELADRLSVSRTSQAALGHSNPETTKRYTDVPADAMLAFVQAAGS